MLNTYTLTVIAQDTKLSPVEGAEVSVKLEPDMHTTEGTILGVQKTAITNASGTATFNLLANEDGSGESHYLVTIKKADTKLTLSRGIIKMPKEAANFHEIVQ